MVRKAINFLRYLIASLFYKSRFGKKVFIGTTTHMTGIPKVTVSRGGTVYISAHCGMEKCEIVAINGGTVQIGEHTFLGSNDIVVSRGNVIIGSNCSIAPNVSIYDHNHVFGALGLQQGYTVKDVQIGNNVWIGVGVIILAGTTIGDNCVIGAGSVVHGCIPKNSLVTNSREIKVRELKDFPTSENRDVEK